MPGLPMPRVGPAFIVAGIMGALLAGAFPRAVAEPQVRPGRQVPDEGAEHVPEGTPIRYRNSPPTSGPHYPLTVEWGVYTEPIPEGYWVHNLEHGGIVLLYNCPEGCLGLVRQVEGLYRSLPPGKHRQIKLVVAPYLKMKRRLAILAWNWIDEMDGFDPNRILGFYRAHVDRGPQDVP